MFSFLSLHLFIRPMNLRIIRLEGRLMENKQIILQLSTASHNVIFTSSPIEWRTSSGKKSSKSSTFSLPVSNSQNSNKSMSSAGSSSSVATAPSSSPCDGGPNQVNIEIEGGLLLCGDVKLQIFYKHMKPIKKSKLCQCWFNTYFVEKRSNSSPTPVTTTIPRN